MIYNKEEILLALKGLDLIVNNKSIKDYAKELITISKKGLKNRKMYDSSGNDETGYLNQLEEIANSGKNQAAEMLSILNNSKEAINEIYEKYSY